MKIREFISKYYLFIAVFIFITVGYLISDEETAFYFSAVIYPFIALMPVMYFIPIKDKVEWSFEDRFSILLISVFIASLLWLIGEMIYCWYYNLYLQIEIPYPSIADVFFIAGYVPYIYGLILYAIFLFKEFKIKVKLKEVLAIHAVYLPALAISVYVLVSPWYEALVEGEDPVVLALDLTYILFDLIILAVSLYILLFIRGKVGVIFFLIALGGILIVIYDVLFTYLDTLELYYDGHPIELLDLYSYMTDAIAFYKAKEIL